MVKKFFTTEKERKKERKKERNRQRLKNNQANKVRTKSGAIFCRPMFCKKLKYIFLKYHSGKNQFFIFLVFLILHFLFAQKGETTTTNDEK
jgi:hypothetical protein